MGTLEQVEKVMKEQAIPETATLSMDESSMRVFSLDLSTIHWKGGKHVPVEEELQNKLTLSMSVGWYGDGSMEFCIVWKKPKSNELKWDYSVGSL